MRDITLIDSIFATKKKTNKKTKLTILNYSLF